MTEDLNAAMTDFNICLQINPNHSDALKNKAQTSFKLGKFEEATLDYTNLIKTDSNNPEYFTLRGICHLESKQYEKALADFNEALASKKDFAEAYFNRANTYTKLLDMKKACEDIKQSAKLGYEPAKAHINNLCN
jgi:tetratricopeptide (TPR) repeat protein